MCVLVDKSVPTTAHSDAVQLAMIAHHHDDLEDEARGEVARE